MDHRPTATYAEFIALMPWRSRLRAAARDLALRGLALGRRIDADTNWIRFPYYHHVFDDEREGFARQLDYMASLGDFIGLDGAVAMLEAGDPIDGRYFCVTFDDGFKNWITNAVPILLDKKAPAAFFVVSGYIGTSPDRDREKLLGFYDSGDLLMEFLDWDDCRKMDAAGMTIGSHTMNHVHLADHDDEKAEAEMKGSKETIEKELGRTCDHFCCPFGREGVDFVSPRHPDIARKLGYRTFLTTRRGPVLEGASAMDIPRDHLLAGWGDYQLRYFFSR